MCAILHQIEASIPCAWSGSGPIYLEPCQDQKTHWKKTELNFMMHLEGYVLFTLEVLFHTEF